MKITIRIADIEVIVDRPNFKEGEYIDFNKNVTNELIKPIINEAFQQAAALFKLKNQP